jgi:hypothetical protein
MRPGRLLGSVFLLVWTAGLASAQQIPFTLLATENGVSATLANGTTIAVNSPVGAGVTVDIKATYTGNAQATVAQPPQIIGSTSFTATIDGTLPLVLNTGDSLTMHVVYRPANVTTSSAQLTLLFTEPSGSNTGPPTTQGAIILGLQGTAPQFTLSYVLQSVGNVIALSPGGTILFTPPTPVNTTAQAALNITNTGSGPGQVSNIALTAGTAFKLQDLPLFPFTLGANQTFQVLVLYQPTAVQSDTGQIQVTFQTGNTVTVNLQGSGSSAAFTYSIIQNGVAKPVKPPGPIQLPDTNVGETNSLIVEVQNTGNANGAVNSVSIAGQGFQLTGLPLFPQILKTNDSFSFSIAFTPAQAGTLPGQLAIGSDLFTLSGQGLGPKLAFSYVSSAGTITLPPATAVVFTPIAVAQSEKVTFIAKNTGTLTATVSNIGIGEAKSPFALSGLPPLPLSLPPGQSSQFTISFTPVATGFSNGTLVLDTTTVALLGSGTAPPPLPSYTIQGPTGNVSPATQSGVSLTLASPYPLALAGTLALTTAGNLSTDPAVQFATGGRTVAFSIPANGTIANFASQGPQILLQTGTVAETVTLTPSFVTQSGGVDVTPASPTTLQFTIPSAAPVLVTVQATGQTTSSFTLNVVGYSTGRTLNSLNLVFTAATGFSLPSSQFTVDLHQVASNWFQSAASQSFGGQFEISIPFTLQGTPPTGKTLLQSLASVAATVTNDVGTSNSLQTNVQ